MKTMKKDTIKIREMDFRWRTPTARTRLRTCTDRDFSYYKRATILRRIARRKVCVHDNGIGIRPEAMPTIFEAFEQGDEGITRRFGGLGLAITKGLVQLHGGNIRAESEGAGKGATFILEFPAL